MDANKREALIRRALDPASTEAEVAKALEVLRKAGVKYEDIHSAASMMPGQSAAEKPRQTRPARSPEQQSRRRATQTNPRTNRAFKSRVGKSESAASKKVKGNPIKLHEPSFRDDAALFIMMAIVMCIVFGSLVYLIRYNVL